MAEAQTRQDEIDAAAAGWVVRLGGGPLDAAARAGLDAWLAESPAHRAAFSEARHAWGVMGGVKAPAPRRTRFAGRSGLRAAALAACLALAVAAGLFMQNNPFTFSGADYATAYGERAEITLPDGSRVELGPASAIALHYSGEARRIELLEGLAYFEAAPAAAKAGRPFIVETEEGTARALGTAFMVVRGEGRTGVTVTEHQVEVTAFRDGRSAGASLVLSPGEAASYGADTGLGELVPADLSQALAWRRGRLIFDQVPLAEVVDELNRYHARRIVIADGALAARKVSGVFDTRDPDAILETVARELDLTALSLPPLVTLLY